jgi:hypothetical protein
MQVNGYKVEEGNMVNPRVPREYLDYLGAERME